MGMIELTAQDVTSAANFLEQFLSNAVPAGDFSQGTALRDLTVGALASVFAFLRNEARDVRSLQSLDAIKAAVGIADPAAVKSAVSAILSNVFINLKSGTKARGYVIGHATEQVDVFIPTSIRFFSASGLVFYVDADSTYFVPKTDLTPIIDADNTVLDWVFRIPLVAAKTGVEYMVSPGLFSGFDRFNTAVTRVESLEAFGGGKGVETVEEVLARAPTAMSVRNLINDRAITAVLSETYPEIQSVLVVGMGDPEMQRDVLAGTPAHLALHVGGMVDAYLMLDLVETSTTGVVGGTFARPDGLATVFRDAARDFSGVEPGDIIRITAGLTVVPAEFMVTENLGTDLLVSERSPFPIASDEGVPPTTVDYTIGRVGPSYEDVISDLGVPYTTGITSRTVGTSGSITLPGGPVIDILDVALLNPASPAEDDYVDPLDGYVHFTKQVNGTPTLQLPGADLEFSTYVHNPQYAQTSLQWMDVVVGPSGDVARYDGSQLRVRYRTLVSFASIDDFIRSRRQRTSVAHMLGRGHHPVTVGVEIVYKLKATAVTALDDDAIVQGVIQLINTFDTAAQPIDTSAIEQYIRNTYPTIASITPLVVTYALRVSTGDILTYETSDEVILTAAKQTSGPDVAPMTYGISDRTIRYVANVGSVSARQVA